MDMRYPIHPTQYERMNSTELREQFHISDLFVADSLSLTYTHIDRVIVGGATPVSKPVELGNNPFDPDADHFLDRREIGIINIGGAGSIAVDGATFVMAKRDGLYIGRNTKAVTFESADGDNPAKFYLFSAPAHAEFPTVHLKIDDAEPLQLGDPLNSNKRTIYKYIHPDGAKSCQVVMGMTLLEPGNMWNTMPAHLHARRMEVYCYFDIDAENVVFHLMGNPSETRHIVMRDGEAVISPSWSIHAGMGTGSYTFIWAMAGENQSFADMDSVSMAELR